MSFFRKKPETFKRDRKLSEESVAKRIVDNNNIEDNDEKEIQDLFKRHTLVCLMRLNVSLN